MKCSFGCGQPAKHMVAQNLYCCEKVSADCPEMKRRFQQDKAMEEFIKKGIDVEVRNIAGYRSKPDVSMANDMVQVTLALSKHNWRGLKKLLHIDNE